MQVDGFISADMAAVPKQVQRLESLGYQGAKIAELEHDPFLPLAIAAAQSSRIQLMTSVAVAFARNPMSMASIAHDLNAFSQGRFILGLGTQVKPHVVKRFGMPWHKGPRQMREFINAMQAIFDCWYLGEKLDFAGEYYQHSLMPKTFTPTNISAGRPKILLSATGPLMTKVAAEVADGLIMHPFSTERYIREVNLPAVNQGLAKTGRLRENYQVDFAPLIATGNNDQEIAQAAEAVKHRIAFYGSTPGYRGVLELHGWGDLQPELNHLMREHKNQAMADLISDEVLHTFAVVGEPEDVVKQMLNRYGDIIDRTAFSVPSLDDDVLGQCLQTLAAA